MKWKWMLMLLALAIVSVAGAEERARGRTLDECEIEAEIFLDQSIDDDTYYNFDLSDDEDGSCGRRDDDDVTYQIVIEEAGLYTFSAESFSQLWMYITTECCGGDQLFPRGFLNDNSSTVYCMWLAEGEYYLTIEGHNDGELYIYACGHPCDGDALQEGLTYSEGRVTFVETVDATSGESNYGGPWLTEGAPCQDESANEDGEWVGFGYYNWYNQDFGWRHLFSTEGLECLDFTIDSACVVICAYENDYCFSEGGDESREFSYCQWDLVHFENDDYDWGILNPDVYPGNNLSFSETKFGIPTWWLEDGVVDVNLDIDAYSDQCAWATTVHSSKLIVYMSCRQIPPQPDGYDLGDLPNLTDEEQPCYPTGSLEQGGPANAVYPEDQQVAWLGECVNHELFPNFVDSDGCDDGVVFIPSDWPGGSWMPGEEACVDVTVSTGSSYVPGTPLYIWGWKDGNLDCDFDDYFEPMQGDDTAYAYECIIPGYLVADMQENEQHTYTICFTDPGVLDFGRYDGHLRFRLLSCGRETPSRDGEFVDCTSAQTFIDDLLGETEDYMVEDLQLPIELLSLTANGANGRVVLNWSTASEQENDAFEVQRWFNTRWERIGNLVDGAGTSATQHNYMFADTDVQPGQTYRYRLVTMDVNGNRMPVGEVESTVEAVNTTIETFALHQNYPNPFNPSTQITYDLADESNVNLMVFDLLGRTVATLVNGPQEAGRYAVQFDATGLPSGMYFYRLETAQFTDMKKMMILK